MSELDLRHNRENKRTGGHCQDTQELYAWLLRQWRDPDGSIPWAMMYTSDDGDCMVYNIATKHWEHE